MPSEFAGLSLDKWPVRDLKAALRLLGASIAGCVERGDFVEVLLAASVSQLRTALGKASPSEQKDDAETKAGLLRELLDAPTKAQRPADDDSNVLQPKTVVRLFNLQSAPALNMQKAVVLGRDPTTERYEVRLDFDGSIKKVRYENLQVEEFQPAQHEDQVEAKRREAEEKYKEDQRRRQEEEAEAKRREAEERCKEEERRRQEELAEAKRRETEQKCKEEEQRRQEEEAEAKRREAEERCKEEERRRQEEEAEAKRREAEEKCKEEERRRQEEEAEAKRREAEEKCKEEERKRQDEEAEAKRLEAEERCKEEERRRQEEEKLKEEAIRHEAEAKQREAEQRRHEEEAEEERRREARAEADRLLKQVQEEEEERQKREAGAAGEPLGFLARALQEAADREIESQCTDKNAQDVQTTSGSEGPDLSEAGADADKENQSMFEECFSESTAFSPSRADNRHTQSEAPHVLVLPAAPSKSPAPESPAQSLVGSTPPKATKLRLGYGLGRPVKMLGRMSEGVRDLWRSGDLCDLTVACRESTFRVHSLVLASHSKKLREFVKGKSEVTLPGVRYPETVQLLLEFLYEAETEQGYAPSSHEVNNELLQTAHVFDLPPLKRQAAVFLAQSVTTQNVVEALLQCEKFELEDLRERIFCQLAKNKSALADVTRGDRMSEHPELLRQILLRVANENGVAPRAKRARLVT